MSILVIFKPGFTDEETVRRVEDFLIKGGFRFQQLGEPMVIPRPFFEDLYVEHLGKPFYEDNLNYVCSGPCRIGIIRTDTHDVEPTKLLDELVRSKEKASVRSLYGKSIRENVLHCSDSLESRQREVKLAIRHGLL